MPETICLFNQKGGSGKSTSTILLALGIAEMTKRRVGILDRDPQQTATRLHSKLKADQPDLRIDMIAEGQNTSNYDTIFIDVAGYKHDALAQKSVAEVDKVLIVTTPSPTDLDVTQEAVEFVRKKIRPHTKIALLFVRVRSNTLQARAINQIADYLGVRRLQATLRDALRYQDIKVHGRKVITVKDLNDITRILLELHEI
jgi:cellulose biosynthesis protein BcsQ